MTSILLILAALGWSTSVLGAVTQYKYAWRASPMGPLLELPLATGSQRLERLGLAFTIIGASAGGLGTVLAVALS